MPQPQYEVRNPEIEELLLEVGRKIKSAMPQGWGFSLMICSIGDDGAMFYLSSLDRQDMMKAMREFIRKNEAN